MIHGHIAIPAPGRPANPVKRALAGLSLLIIAAMLTEIAVLWRGESWDLSPVESWNLSLAAFAALYGLELWIGIRFALAYCVPDPGEVRQENARAARALRWALLALPFVAMAVSVASRAVEQPTWKIIPEAVVARIALGAQIVQYCLAIATALLVVRVYWNVFETYWDLAWHCPFLAAEVALLVGLGLGRLMQSYGLVILFWGEGFRAGALIVPFLSAFMFALTFALLTLCAYFQSTVAYEEVLAEGPGGMPRERQIFRRVSSLWKILRNYDDPHDRRQEPGRFVWWCLRPALVLMALPAAVPILSVDPMPERISRGAWIVGLAFGGWLLRYLLVARKVADWVTRLTRGTADRCDFTGVGYPMIMGPRALILIAAPLLIALLAAHIGDFAGSYDTRPIALMWVAVLVLSCAVVIRSLRWPRQVRKRYVATSVAVVATALVLALSASAAGMPIAAPFSISFLLIVLGVGSSLASAYVSGFIGRRGYRRIGERTVRRSVQLASILFVVAVVWANGHARHSGPLTWQGKQASLREYDDWYERAITRKPAEAAPAPQAKPRFGSPELLAARDVDVLKKWQLGAQPTRSDEPMAVGFWRRSSDDQATWIKDEVAKPKLVVVAASGGGLRAAVWASRVLAEIERGIPEFPDRTRLITGSSGGMFGAATYVTGLQRRIGQPLPPRRCQTPRAVVAKTGGIDPSLRLDFLTPVVNRMIFGDLSTMQYWGWPAVDRGDILERGFYTPGSNLTATPNDLKARQPAQKERAQPLGVTFADLATRGERDGAIPSLIFTPMMVEDSRRLIISNLELGSLTLNNGSFDAGTGRETYQAGPDFPSYSCSGVQLFHLMPGLYTSLQVGSAVRMNATFPYVTPAVSLPMTNARRVVDAGYYDNYGVDLTVAWLEEHRRWLELNTSGVILIQVRAFSNENQLKDLESQHESSTVAGFFDRYAIRPIARGSQFLTTPLAGVGGARMNVNYYRNDSAVENLKRSFTFDMLERLTGISTRDFVGPPRRPGGFADFTKAEADLLATNYPAANGFFRVITFTCNDEIDSESLSSRETLNWFLSHGEFDKILKNWETVDNYRRFRYLKGIFRRNFNADDEEGDEIAGQPLVVPERWEARPSGFANDPVSGTWQGRRYLVAEAGTSKEPPASFTWKFRKTIPPGRYKLGVNVPNEDRLASNARYTVRLSGLAGGPPRNFACVLDARKKPDDNPDWQRDDRPQHQNLGRWYVLGQGLEIPEPGAEVEVELSNEGADGRVVADSIRLDWIQ